MKSFLNEKDIKPIILLALREDIGNGDITTNAIFNCNGTSEAVIIAKENGIFCGSDVVKLVYEEIDPTIKVAALKSDGKYVKNGTKMIRIKGQTKNILIGERTVLNFLQRMSGIATKTSQISSILKGTDIKLLDTRKTIPGFRLLDKYSVKIGGGYNHRLGLFDMIMIKDNHIKAAGSITKAVNLVKKAYDRDFKIEVEAKNLKEVEEALKSDIDIIMLDNMDRKTMEKAIDLINGKTKIEISGDINEDNIKDLVDLKIDFMSMGALTHSVRAFDLSMYFQ